METNSLGVLGGNAVDD